MNRRSFLIDLFGLTVTVSIFEKLLGKPSLDRNELDSIDTMDYCPDDGKITVVGMDGDRSSIWRTEDREAYFEVGTPPRMGRITAFATMDSTHWLVGYEDGEMWKTKDAGKSWERERYLIVGELQR